ncbi:MAG: sigma-70 family RNA polymerase sigma factor [Planctomycetota bacterium]
MSPANIKREVPSNIARTQKVFEEHGDFIRSVIRFNVRNEALCEDLFQDLLLFLISKPIPEDVQNVRGFLYRVISDKIKDTFRRIDRYHERIHRYAEHRAHIIEHQPENSLIEVEETKKMFDLIGKKLPSKEALAITLRYMNSYDTTKIAEKMGIKSRSVSRYVSVGIKKIRQVFGVN